MAKFQKFEYLDSMRGIAILLIIFYHVGNMLGFSVFSYFPSVTVDIVSTFQYSVQMFFIVSAFTLMMSYDNRKDETQPTKKFFIRRFFRIAPMYYVAIAYTTFLIVNFDFVGYNWADFPKKAFISNVLFVNAMMPSTINNFVVGGWSVSNEFLFYLCLPVICAKIKSLNGYIIFTLLSLLLCSLLLFVLKGTVVDTNNFLSYYFFSQIPIFGLGMTAYWINKEGGFAHIKPSVLVLLIFTVFTYCIIDLPYHFLVSLVTFIIILTLSRKPYKIVSNKIFAEVGKVSFSMYLMHFLVMHIIERFGFRSLVNIHDTVSAAVTYLILFLFLAISSYLVSCVTYKYIEKGGQNIGKKIISRLNN